MGAVSPWFDVDGSDAAGSWQSVFAGACPCWGGISLLIGCDAVVDSVNSSSLSERVLSGRCLSSRSVRLGWDCCGASLLYLAGVFWSSSTLLTELWRSSDSPLDPESDKLGWSRRRPARRLRFRGPLKVCSVAWYSLRNPIFVSEGLSFARLDGVSESLAPSVLIVRWLFPPNWACVCMGTGQSRNYMRGDRAGA